MIFDTVKTHKTNEAVLDKSHWTSLLLLLLLITITTTTVTITSGTIKVLLDKSMPPKGGGERGQGHAGLGRTAAAGGRGL